MNFAKMPQMYMTLENFIKQGTPGQGGGIGRYTLPPHTTKRRPTTNFNTKNTKKCHKIKLYESPTTKELKKKYSSRLVGGEETGSQGGEDVQQGSSPIFTCG